MRDNSKTHAWRYISHRCLLKKIGPEEEEGKEKKVTGTG